MVLLKQTVEQALLPLQTTPPAQPAHKVYRGFPVPETLNNDLRQNIVHVSIAVAQAGDRADDSMITSMQQLTDPDVQLTAVVSGTQLNAASTSVPATGTITLSGTVVAGTHTMTQIGDVYVPYTPPVGATPAQVATAVASAVNANTDAAAIATAVAVGNVITVTTVGNAVNGHRVKFDFKIGGTALMVEETGRRHVEFQINVYGYDDPSRARYANTLDTALSAMDFLVPEDDVPAKLVYVRSQQIDRELSHVVYRRTLVYSVQYTQTALTTGYQVLAELVKVQRGG
jgi:hypothetical protein